MDLDTAQSQGQRRQRPRAAVRGEYVGSAAPREILVDAPAELGCEKLPIDSLGSPTKGRHCHLRKPKLRLLPRCLVPDFADASVQVVRLAMERALTDRADKAFDRGVVNLVGFD